MPVGGCCVNACVLQCFCSATSKTAPVGRHAHRHIACDTVCHPWHHNSSCTAWFVQCVDTVHGIVSLSHNQDLLVLRKQGMHAVCTNHYLLYLLCFFALFALFALFVGIICGTICIYVGKPCLREIRTNQRMAQPLRCCVVSQGILPQSVYANTSRPAGSCRPNR